MTLEARGVGRCVDDRWIVRSVSFVLEPGERLAVVGPSGSGKTLLLRGLAALDDLDEGDVVYEGRELGAWWLPEYRSRVVYLHQTPRFAEGTVEENLRAVLDLGIHADRSFDRGRIVGWLDRLGRGEDLLDRDVEALSGGEAQMTAFIRAFQVEPDVLLLDEPSASLDDAASRALEALVEGWLDERAERAVIWTSHDAAQIERVAGRRIDLATGDGDGGEVEAS